MSFAAKPGPVGAMTHIRPHIRVDAVQSISGDPKPSAGDSIYLDKGPLRARECAMSPTKQRFVGLAGCQLVVGRDSYRLRDGKSTLQLAVTLSLLRAEPSLRRCKQGVAISCEAATALGYQVARTYDDAAMFGLV